ncbi:MAG: hypothetical protein IJ410_05965 [Oscillospiraceae bacterium]|nr:hypothetical protein [Oscillospiraceae bacterium]
MIKQEQGKKEKRQVYRWTDFKGVDYAHAPANVSPQRCVDGMNMVRSEVGKIHKRTGYRLDSRVWMGNINGVHFLRKGDEEICLVHCGENFYIDGVSIYSDAADNFSRSVQIADKLYILDGKRFVTFDGENVKGIAEGAYIPTIYINKKPVGGGEKYEQVNILTQRRCEGFIADGVSVLYMLSRTEITIGSVTAVVYADDGSAVEYTDGSGITVDSARGTVTFATAPPAPRNPEESNVFIVYEKDDGNDSTVLDKCTVMAMFGPGGKPDTLFISGNPDHPGREWFSQGENPAFFGRENTDLAGSTNSPVTGYSVKGDKLFVHRRNGERNLNILVRSCSGGDENFYSYPVVNALEGPSAVSRNSFVNMAGDALFLTGEGVYAITEKEAEDRHFTQLRSFYINPVLKDKIYTGCTAVAYGDFYVLASGSDIFLLDTLQKSHEEDKEYSRYQYECFHWQIPEDIRLLFVQEGRLCFATTGGKIGRFYTDYNSPASFNDAGRAIHAVWQSGEFDGDNQVRNKTVHRLWVTCATAVRTSVNVLAQIKGVWHGLFVDDTTARYFKWSEICWSKFTWSTDKTPKIISRGIRLKNVDKTAIRLENNTVNEPFGLYEAGFEYTTGSYYR